MDGEPKVVKPAGGAAGRGLSFDVKSVDDLRAAMDGLKGSVLLQDQISGESYRLIVVGPRLFAVHRKPGDSGRGRLHRRHGAVQTPVDVGLPLQQLAFSVARRLGLDLLAVDVIAADPDSEGIVIGLDSHPPLEDAGPEALAAVVDDLFAPFVPKEEGPVGVDMEWRDRGDETAMYTASIVGAARDRGLRAFGAESVGPAWTLLASDRR
ncbi:MAG: hypothetical protein GY825_15140, partial [Phycisphaeraceae bacterium]|nr:hypothetical protein [Phycisphaeraceae bacterium]